MQAIVTRFHGPTNNRGSRYSATACAGRVYVESDGRFGPDKNCELAALALCKRFNWTGELVSGGLKDGSTVFVFTGRD